MAMAGESTRATTMAGEYQDEYARVAEARAPGPEQGEDCSVPVGFLTSTFANPDLGYRIPTSASALLAHRSVDRARQLTEGPRGRQAFSMSEVDLREHARARYRVEAERRKHEVAAALELERYEREHHFLEVDGGRPHIAPPGRERPHLDRAAQKLKLRRRAPGVPFVDTAPGLVKAADVKPYRPLVKEVLLVGSSIAAGVCKQRTRAVEAFKRERLTEQKARSKRDTDLRKAEQERDLYELRHRIVRGVEAEKKISLRQRYVANKYRTKASIEAKAQMLKCLRNQYLQDPDGEGPEPDIAWKETKNESGTVYARESVCRGAPPREPRSLRRDTLTLPDPPGYRRKKRPPREADRPFDEDPPARPVSVASAGFVVPETTAVALPPMTMATPPASREDAMRPVRRPAIVLAAASVLEGASVLDEASYETENPRMSFESNLSSL